MNYAELLAHHQPAIIETPDEHDRMLSLAEQLMEKGDALTPEEEKLLALVVLIIESFESTIEEGGDEDQEDEDAETPKPHETLQRLLSSRGLEIADVADIFGNPHIARDVLEGARPISRGQAKQLAKYFRVPAKLFHE